MDSVAFDRFLQDLAALDVYPDPSDIQAHDVAAIWEQVPDQTQDAYLRDLGLSTDAPDPHLDGSRVVFGSHPPTDEGDATLDSLDGPAPDDAHALEAARLLSELDPGEVEIVEPLDDGANQDPPEGDGFATPSVDPASVETVDVEADVPSAELDAVEPLDELDDVDVAHGEIDDVPALDEVTAEQVPTEPLDAEVLDAETVDAEGQLEEASGEAIEEIAAEESNVREVEVYPVYEPYGYVRISYDEDDHQYLYDVIEPELSEREEKILDFVQETIVDVIDVGLSRLTNEEAEEMLVDLTNEVITDYSIEVDENTRLRLTYYVVRDFLGFGKLDVIMRDPMIEDVSCDGVGVPIFLYHRKYESMGSTVVFEEHEELDSFVIKLAQRSGKHISVADPLLDARLPDGSRLNATLSDEVTTKGSTFTIRKFRDEPFTPPDLIRFGTMSPEMLGYFWMAIQHGASMIVAGGTASGKTTMLNAVLLFIPPQMKIVSIEDTRELNLPHPNWIPGTTRSGFGPRDDKGRQAGEIDMFQLLKAALRQRPEYITVGEVRGEEATVLFQAMATGHAAYGTMHADSVTSVIHRLEGEPINIPRPLLEALDIVAIQIQTRIGGKRVRRTKEIVEIVGMDPNTKELLTNEVFGWDPADDSFDPSGISYVLERIQKEENLSRPELEQEIDNRTLIINWMKENEVRDYVDVAKVVQAYYTEPEKLMQTIRVDLGLEDAEDLDTNILADVLEDDGLTEDEDDFDARAEIPTPEDETAVSPLAEHELEQLDGAGSDDPVQDAYESNESPGGIEGAPTVEMDEPLAAELDDDTDPFSAEHEAEPLDAEPVDAEPLESEPADAQAPDAGVPDVEPAEAEPIDAEPLDEDALEEASTEPGPREAAPFDAEPVAPDEAPGGAGAGDDAKSPPPDVDAADVEALEAAEPEALDDDVLEPVDELDADDAADDAEHASTSGGLFGNTGDESEANDGPGEDADDASPGGGLFDDPDDGEDPAPGGGLFDDADDETEANDAGDPEASAGTDADALDADDDEDEDDEDDPWREEA